MAGVTRRDGDGEREERIASLAEALETIINKILVDRTITADVSRRIVIEVAVHCHDAMNSAVAETGAASISERVGTIAYFVAKLAPIHLAYQAAAADDGEREQLLSVNEQVAVSLMILFLIEASLEGHPSRKGVLDSMRLKRHLHDLFAYDDGLFYKSLIYDLRYRPITRECLVALARSILIGASVGAPS